MSSKTWERFTDKNYTLTEESVGTLNSQSIASPNWKSYKGSVGRELIDDWKSFSSYYKSTVQISTKHHIWATERTSLLPPPLQPISISKIHNIDSDDDDDDEYSYRDRSTADTDIPSVRSATTDLLKHTHSKQRIWSDTVFLNNNNRIFVVQLDSPNSLNTISIPSAESDYTVAITYHTVTRKSVVVLKLLQLYVSTGVSYIVLIDRTCLLKNLHTIKDTAFGFLLADTSVRRVCWNPDYIQKAVEQQTCLTIGSCVDLSCSCEQLGLSSSLDDVFNHSLEGWQDKVQFNDLKRSFEEIKTTLWNRSRLPNAAEKYCAIEGWTVYSLYLATL
ncbi:hypothetical protein MFLAVUS_005345 [Mucor flavus]|uniref:Uncharacterized protein n=1 Tax=Mucor flavus TaxID=439312 RepID=A0ABP9YYF8_9FUNG